MEYNYNSLREWITKKNNNKLKIVTIGGMIGVGKTSLIQKLVEQDKKDNIKSKVVYELFEDTETSIFPQKNSWDDMMDILIKMYYNNIDFLKSPNHLQRNRALGVTLFHQMNFLVNRAMKTIEAIEEAEKLGLDVLYLDRTIFEDIIFVKRNLFNEPLYYNSYARSWEEWFNRLDLAVDGYEIKNIILDAKIETILHRIKKRGREMEQGADVEGYFRDLNKNYVNELKDNMILKRWRFEVINNEDVDYE